MPGHTRYFELLNENNKNITQNVDIFVHTWDTIGYKFHNPLTNKYDIDNSCGLNEARFLELIHPKKYIVENENNVINKIQNLYEWDIIKCHTFHDPLRNYLQMYSITFANNLKTNYEKNTGVKYEVIVKSRFDILFIDSYIDIINSMEIEDNTIYMPEQCNELCIKDWGGLNDVFFFGNSHVMNKILNLCDNIDMYLTDSKFFNLENFLVSSVKLNNFKIKRVNIKYILPHVFNKSSPKQSIENLHTIYPFIKNL
jgi:hypothetical protein